jgi:hypothetical protein
MGMRNTILICILLGLIGNFSLAQETPQAKPDTGSEGKVFNNTTCPFRRDSSSVDQLVKQARSALQNLADQNAKCPATKKIAEQMEKNLSAILEYNQRKNDSQANLDTNTLSCSNYESVMREEFEFVVNQNQLRNTSWVQSNVSRYSSCGNSGAGGDPFEVCASKIYAAGLKSQMMKCNGVRQMVEDKGRATFQQNVLKDLATDAKILLENSKQCQGDPQTSKFVLQSVLGAVSSLGYLSSGPLMGAATALTGDLLSSFIQRFFQDKSPSALVDYIDAEYQSEELNCLYYELQNRSLNCGQLIRRFNPVACNRDTQFFYMISSIGQIEAVVEREKDQDALLKELDKLNSIFRTGWFNEVHDPQQPNEPALPARDLMKKIAGPDFPADELWQASQEISGAYNDPGASPETRKQALLKLLKPIRESLDRRAKGGEAFSETLKRKGRDYWIAADKGTEYEKNINAMFAQKFDWDVPAFSPINEKTVRELVDASGAQNKLDIAHSAFLAGYQKKFERRLEEIAERFEQNRKFQSDEDSALDLIPLVQMCSLNASMFYFESTDMTKKVRNNLSSRPSSAYRSACSLISCQIPPFDLNRFPEERRPREFRNYQCSMPFKYPEALDKILKNMKKLHRPCP